MLLRVHGPTAALADLQRAAELDPANATAHFEYGQVSQLLGHDDQALAAFTRAVAAGGTGVAPAHYQAGLIYERQGHIESALGEFTACLRLNPQMAQAYSALARSHEAQQSWEQALFNLDRAIQLAPGLAGPYYQRGGIAYRQGHFEQALRGPEPDAGTQPRPARRTLSPRADSPCAR